MIKVTQEHIDKGVPFKMQACPVKLALDDCSRVPDCRATYGHLLFDGEWQQTPEVATEFMKRFDNNLEVHPFEFEI